MYPSQRAELVMSDDKKSLEQEHTQQMDSIDLSVDKSKYESEGTSWFVEIVRGPMTGEKVLLEEEKALTFGRGSDCDVFLDDITVSRHHCEIIVENDVVTLKDLGSTNGTYVDSQEVETKRLYAGDVIQIGRYLFILTRRSAT